MRETGRDRDAPRQRRASTIGDISTRDGQLSFLVRDATQVDAARERLQRHQRRRHDRPARLGHRRSSIRRRFVLTPTEAGLTQAIDTAMDDATEVVRRRIDELGTQRADDHPPGREPHRRAGAGAAEPAGAEGPARQDRASSNSSWSTRPPTPPTLAQGQRPGRQPGPALSEQSGGRAVIAVKRSAIITGDQLIDARQEFDQQTNAPRSSITFDGAGRAQASRR